MLRKTRTTGISLTLLLLMTSFQNCSKVGFSKGEEAAGIQSIQPIPIPEALATCAAAAAQNAMHEQEHPVFFDNPLNEVGHAPVCSWGQSGNAGVNNGYMTARYNQYRDIQLPPGAVLCGADFLFAPQAMEYDDNFFFTVNDYILATNDDYWQKNYLQSRKLAISATQELTVSTFDWSRMVGHPNSSRAMAAPGVDYCMGEREGLSSCSWPRTEVAGTINMAVNSNIMTAVGLQAQSGKIRLGFITTGDDDTDIDCQHEPLSFKIKVRYVIP